MRALPPTRVPCYYPAPLAEMTSVAELNLKYELEAESRDVEVRVQAFAVAVRAMMGTTAEFAYWLDEDRLVFVESIDEHGAAEKYEVVARADVQSGLEGLKIQLVQNGAELAPEVDFGISDTANEVKLRYNPRLIPVELAQRLFNLYTWALVKTQEAETDALSILNYLPKKYSSEAETPAPALLHAPFLLSAQSRPTHPAVDYLAAPGLSPQRHTLSYAELDKRSAALAKVLLSLSGRGNDVVPFLIPASAEIYVAYLGILRAGKAFAPLPTLDGAPIARVLELIEDVGANVVVGVGERPEWLVKGVEWVDVTGVEELQERASRTNVELKELVQNPDELAYVLFTSGSTGKPKGVQITHRAAATSIHGHLSVRRVSPTARWFQFAAATFDPSVMEIFCTLACGATLLSADRPRFLSDPDKALAELGATNMMATPSMAAVLKADRILALRDELYGPVDGVEHKFELWTMGEKLSDRVIAEFTRPAFALYNAYGPTEAAINVTLRAHPQGESGARLGPPLPTASMLVLHPTENCAVTLGFAGELALAGDQLAKGYLNNPEQTARAFVDVPGVGRVYRTGDWARVVIGADGKWSEIEYLGRMGGDQVKISGRRVELGEIDSVLSALPGVQAVLSVVSNERLSALVVPDNEGAAQEQIVEHLQKVADDRLPLHMRPAAYYFAMSVPRSSSGKADRRAAARIIGEREQEAQAEATPNVEEVAADDDEDISPELKLVKGLIADIAEVPLSTVRARSSLLRLGVDSLKAVRLLALLRDTGAKELSGLGIADVLGCETVADIVSVAMSKSQNGDEARGATVEQTIRTFRASLGAEKDAEIWPATPMQAGVLALYLRSEGGRGYINHSVFHLREDIDVGRLKEAWAGVVRRNGILRAKFVLVDDSEAGKIAPFAVIVEKDWEEKMKAWEDREGRDGRLEGYLGEAAGRVGLERPWCAAVLRGKEGESSTFVLTLHHAIFDGASLALMLEELYANYTSRIAPTRPGFEHSVRDALSADTVAAEKYWKGILEGFSQDPFPDLTGLRAHAKNASPIFTADSSPTHHAATVISHTTYSQLQERARILESSPLAVVQAAWGALLLGLSEAETPDIVFGSLIGGRSSPELETAVGPVFTAVPVRVNLSNAAGSTKELLAKLREANAPSVRHRYPPVSVLSGEKGIIYDTTVALQSFARGESQTGLWSAAEYPPMVTEFAAVLEIWPEADNSIRLRLTGSNNVLTPTASTGLLEQFDDIVSAILSISPEASFPAVVAGVRPMLQSALNTTPTRASLPEGSLIHHEFERNAREHPEALAVWFKADLDRPALDIKWTYTELDTRANKLANFLLREYGDLTDVAVPLCMEKSAELYVAIFGVLKAGGAWCPVDAAAPAMRKRDLFGRAGGPVVLVRDQEGLKAHEVALPEGLDILALDDERFGGQSEERPVVRTSPEDLAYLIWTSGTTGAPKGVPIQHKAAVQSLAVLQDDIPAGSDPILCLNFSAYTFDVSVLDVFYALGKCCGTLCSAYKDILVSQFAGTVDAFKATHAFLTPAFMAQSSLAECPTLRTLISIGEKLPDAVADKWCKPGVVSLNTYGPAEATIIATYRKWQLDEATKAHNVGTPIRTVSCYAVKDDLVLPRGAVGELALGGYQNARGYHRQPDMTAKKFVMHPVAGHVYLTGDIVRFLHDGTIEFVGRTDDLVKLGGIRVELSEISNALEGCHPRSAEVFTMQLSRPDRPQKTLVSFIAAPSLLSDKIVCLDFEAVDIASSAMQRAVVALPAFMHPSVYVVIKRLPHTASNKVDRKALAEYYASFDLASWEESLAKVTTGQLEDGTWSDAAEIVRKIVSDLTGTPVERLKKTTPLPALGVDSIRALQLASRLRKAGFSVSVGDILVHSTIQQLVDADAKKTGRVMTTSVWCDDFDRRWRPAVARGLPNEDVRRVIPCTPLQEGMLGETNKNPEAYWSHRLFKLDAGCDTRKLLDAWNTISEQTEALRTVFAPAAAFASQVERIEGVEYIPVFVQLLLSKPALQIRRETHLDVSDAQDFVRNLVVSQSRATAPLWAVTILDKRSTTPSMLVSMHHALYDGPAYDFLLHDVAKLYLHDQPRSRPQLISSVSLAFFSADPRQSQSYWESILRPFADPYPQQFPNLSDHTRKESGFTTREFVLPRDILASAATSTNASIGNILQVAWAIILGAYMHTDRVVFGETRSLRFVDASLEDAIAPMIATVPIAILLDPARPVRDTIEAVAQNTAVHYSQYFVALQHVRKTLQRPVGHALFPAIFVMNADAPDSPTSSPWEETGTLVNLTVEHPLAVNAYVSNTQAIVRVSGSCSVISAASVALLTEQYSAVVRRLLEDLDQPINALTSLDERLLSVLPGRGARRTDASDLSALLSRLTVLSDAIAMTSYGDSGVLQYSYKELEQRSNQIAHWIAKRNPQSRVVAVSLPRDLYSIAYIIGILKSGRTYLAVEDCLPRSRKMLAVRAARVDLLLTCSAYLNDFKSLSSCVVVCVDAGVHHDEFSRGSVLRLNVKPSESAYITFSGDHESSAQGAVVSLNSLTAAAMAFSELLSDGPILAWSPLGSELHLVELLGALIKGVVVVNVPTERVHSLGLKTVLSETRASQSIIPAHMFEKGSLRPADIPDVEHIVLSGVPVTSSFLQEWSMTAEKTVTTIFGVPELSGICTVGTHLAGVVTVGHPRQGLTALVLRPGDTSQVALKGESGDLYFAGETVDYLRANSVGIELPSIGRLVRTGLTARVQPDNSVVLTGRSDVCHLPGRPPVYLSDVSDALGSVSRLPLDIVSLDLEHPQGMRAYIVSFVARRIRADGDSLFPTTSEEDAAMARSLLASGRARLPAHLVPDVVLPLTFLPYSSWLSGAVDSRCLRRLFYDYPLAAVNAQGGESESTSRPLTEMEQRIRDVLSTVTRVPADSIQATTTTLELGIDSLSAISLSLNLKAAGFFVPPHVILTGPTVEKLARASRATPKDVDDAVSWEVHEAIRQQVLAQSQHPIESVLPCLPLQEGLVALTLNHPEPIYVNHFVTILEKDTDSDILKSAVLETIRANGILRTCFFTASDSIVQVVLARGIEASQWRSVDLQGDGLAAVHLDMPNVERDVVANIGWVPPARFTLYQDSAGLRYLCWTLHHAVYDGESLPMIMAEARERYAGTFSRQRPPIDKLLAFLARQSPEAARSFFSDYLDGAPRPTPLSVTSNDSRHQHQRLAVSLSALERRARSLNVSLHALALGAFGVALAEHYQHSDVVSGLVLSGRTILVDGITDIAAPCITTVPVRVRYNAQPLFSDVVAQVHEDMEPIMQFQHTPLRHIQRWVGTGEPLFNTLFNFVRKNSTVTGQSLWTQSESKAALDYPLAIAVEADTCDDSIHIRVGHLASFGSIATVKALVTRMMKLLEDPSQVLPELGETRSSKLSEAGRPTYDNATWSEAETLIRDVVAEACGVSADVVSKDVSFLQLGVDSITSIRLAQLLRTRGLPLPTHAIMRNPCVGALAQYLRETPTESSTVIARREFAVIEQQLTDVHAMNIPLLDRDDKIISVFPATPLQTGMLTETISSGGRLYLVPHTLRLEQSISLLDLRNAVAKTIAQTDILRCTFHAVGDGHYPWLVAVHSAAPLRWNEYRFDTETALRVEVLKIVEHERLPDEEAFERPPMSAHVLEAPGLRVLILFMHHCLYDGLSLPYFLEDVASSYRQQDAPSRPQFLSAAPYILHSSQDQTGFWSKHLAGYFPSPLPHISGSRVETYRARQSFALPGDALQTIKNMGVTVQAVALLAWGKVLATLAHSLDVVFGQVVSGRAIELEDALHASGPLFNTIPFRFTLHDPTWSNEEAAQAQQQANVHAEPYQHVPLRKIQQDWRIHNELGAAALFDSLFVFQQVMDKGGDRSDLWSPFDLSDEPTSAQYPLSLEIVHNGDTIELRAGCQGTVFSEKALLDVLVTLKETILNIVAEPEGSVVVYPPSLADVVKTPRTHPRPKEDRTVKVQRDFTPNERILRDVVSIVSKIPIERIGLAAPLWALGLDSVAAIQITARCRVEGLPITVADVFAGETVMGICSVYDERVRTVVNGAESDTPRQLLSTEIKNTALLSLGLREEEVEDVLPLLAGQDYHVTSWLASGGTFYQPVFAYKANGRLDALAMEQAWRALQRRHSILRTAVVATSPSTAVQVILKATPTDDWRFIETGGELRTIVKQHVQEEYNTPSTLSVPPARVRLLRIDGKDVLLLSLHHVTYDAWTVPLLVADLNALYRGEVCRSNADFTGLVRHLSNVSQADEDAAKEMWREEIRAGTSLLPMKRPDAGLKQVFFRAAGVVSSINALQEKCQTSGISLQGIVLAVWGRVIRELTGAEQPIVGVYHTGRSAAFNSIDVLAGPTVNVLPMRLPAVEGAPVRDVARQLQVEMGRRTKYEQTRLRDIVSWTLGEDNKGPLFNAWLNLLWHGDKIRTLRKGSATLLESFSVGPPTDFVPSTPFEVLRTSVDALDASFLPKLGFFADVVLNTETDSIGLAMRAHEALLSTADLENVVKSFAEGVQRAIDEL